jgi:hypothetical protein
VLGKIGDRQVRFQLADFSSSKQQVLTGRGVMRMEDGLSDLIDLFRAAEICSMVRPAQSVARRAVQQLRTVYPLNVQPLEECSNE